MDNFNQDFSQAEQTQRNLQMLLEEVRDLKKKNPSQSTVAQEYKMKNANIKLESTLANFQLLSNQLTNTPSKFPDLSAKDKQKRIEKITTFKAEAGTTISAYQTFTNNTSGMQADEEQPMIRRKGEDGEYDHTRDLTSEQILKQQQNHIAKQDDKIDEILGVTAVIKTQAQDFSTEAQLQNKMLDKTTANLDKTNTRMVQIDNNMKRLLQKTNQGVLWGILCIEVVVLILLIVL